MADGNGENIKLERLFKQFESLTRKMINVDTVECAVPDIMDYMAAMEELMDAVEHANLAMERIVLKDALRKLTDK